MLGAFLASAFIEGGKRLRFRRIYAVTLLAEAGLLIATGVIVQHASVPANGALVVGTLALAMGIQNAASTRLSGSKVRTTHVSGVATDLGVGLAQLLSPNDPEQKTALLTRLGLNLTTLLSFTVGGVAGVLCYEVCGGYTFSLVGAILLSLSARYIFARANM